MSLGTIDNALVKQFHGNLDVLVQQEGSVLRSSVRNESQASESQFWDQIGSVSSEEILTRHANTPINDPQFDRRRVTLRFFQWGAMIDHIDKLRMLADPQGEYVKAAAWALGRDMDDTILAAVAASVATGKDAGDTTNYNTGMDVEINLGGTNVGMTVPKLIKARRLLKAAEVNLDREKPTVAVSAEQIADLLNSTLVTSTDFAAGKALVDGNVRMFMGFEFRETERLLDNGSTTQYCPFYVRSGLLLAVAPEITSWVAPRYDKGGNTQVYAKAGMGAIRMQETKVGRILCLTA